MEKIHVDRAEGIVTVTLDSPGKLNAISGDMWPALIDVFNDVKHSPTDRVLVLTGAGNEFCSGADLWAAPSDGPPRHQMSAMRVIADAVLALHSLPQPTIAKVPGVAAGVGCSLAIGCDLIVAAERARFSEIFAKRGLSLDGGSSWLLPRLIGLHRAKELAFFADVISAADAEAFGLVNRVVPDAELDAVVGEWAARLAKMPPIALSMTKKMLNESMHMTMEQALEDEGRSQSVNFSTRDTPEAIRAFAEKRAPVFEGR